MLEKDYCEKKLVGIIIPFFKDLQLFFDLLDSVVNQSCHNYEVLIVDDSHEQTLKKSILEKRPYTPFTIIENGNNFGMKPHIELLVIQMVII